MQLSLFYDYELGKAKYIAPGGIVEGEITNKRQFTIKDGKLKRVFDNNTNLLDLEQITLDIPDNSDLIIKSLGFINIKKACKLTIYTYNKDLFEIRKSMF